MGTEGGQAAGAVPSADAPTVTADLVIRIDGRQPLTPASVASVGAVCDSAEDRGGDSIVIVHASGAPAGSWARDLNVALVSRWERALRRLERLPAATIAVVVGDCGGRALDALLATDYRIAAASARLVVPIEAGGTWPGMALYRLARQAGAAAVRRAVLFGTPIDADDALALHLIDEVTGDTAGTLAAAAGLAGSFSSAELAIRRQLLFDAPITSFEDALGVHLAACDRALRRRSAGLAR